MYVEKHDTLKLKSDGSEYMNKIVKIYKRDDVIDSFIIK